MRAVGVRLVAECSGERSGWLRERASERSRFLASADGWYWYAEGTSVNGVGVVAERW